MGRMGERFAEAHLHSAIDFYSRRVYYDAIDMDRER